MGRRSERGHEPLHERSHGGHRQADDVEVVARRSPRRAPRRGPGSRSRRRGPPIRPVADVRGDLLARRAARRSRACGRCAPGRARRASRSRRRRGRRACGPAGRRGTRAPAPRPPACRRRGRRARRPCRRPRTTASARLAGVSAATAAAALRRAFSAASANGSPSSSSGAAVARTSCATPSCARIAVRCGLAEARIRRWRGPGEGLHRSCGAAAAVPVPVRPARGRTAPPRARRTRCESEPWTMFWPTSSA